MEQNKDFYNSTSKINKVADSARKKINRNMMLNPETAEAAPLINMGMKRLEKKLPGVEKYIYNKYNNSPGPVRQPTTREVQNPVFNSPGSVRQPTREVQNPVFNSPGPVRQVQKLNTVQDNENIKAQVIIGLEKAKAEQTGIKVGVAFLSLLVIIGTTLGVLLGIPNIRKDIFASSDAGATAANSSAKIFASSNSSKS